MKKLKQVFRVLILAFLILLALSGIGVMGIHGNRERYRNKEITIEMVDRQENDEESEEGERN